MRGLLSAYDSNAYSRLVLMRLRQHGMDSEAVADEEPGWFKFVAQAGAPRTVELHPALPAHIREVLDWYALEHPEGQFA